MDNRWVALGALLAALAVGAGAFGAHALKGVLTPERLDVWRTAAHYHLVHAVALVAIGASAFGASPAAALGLRLLLVGTLIFSGTLYALCLTGRGWLGAVTPLGGTALIAGWLVLAFKAWSR